MRLFFYATGWFIFAGHVASDVAIWCGVHVPDGMRADLAATACFFLLAALHEPRAGVSSGTRQ
jgi:hypothetical protein